MAVATYALSIVLTYLALWSLAVLWLRVVDRADKKAIRAQREASRARSDTQTLEAELLRTPVSAWVDQAEQAAELEWTRQNEVQRG